MSVDMIPGDDIADRYLKLPEAKRSAVTDLIEAEEYVVASFQDAVGNTVNVGLGASPPGLIHLILNVVVGARDEFGRLWLENLVAHLNKLL